MTINKSAKLNGSKIKLHFSRPIFAFFEASEFLKFWEGKTAKLNGSKITYISNVQNLTAANIYGFTVVGGQYG